MALSLFNVSNAVRNIRRTTGGSAKNVSGPQPGIGAVAAHFGYSGPSHSEATGVTGYIKDGSNYTHHMLMDLGGGSWSHHTSQASGASGKPRLAASVIKSGNGAKSLHNYLTTVHGAPSAKPDTIGTV